VKFSKAQIRAKFHKIPAIRFEDQQLTSFSGLLIFQQLIKRLNLKQRFKKCFKHLARLRKPDNFLTYTIALAMSMILTVQRTSCSSVSRNSKPH
jgi:hypothetical protein